jgi:hypothetical protein
MTLQEMQLLGHAIETFVTMVVVPTLLCGILGLLFQIRSELRTKNNPGHTERAG